MAGLRFQVQGVQEVKREMGRLGRQANDAFQMALFIEGSDILRKSGFLVPVDLENLKGTGAVNQRRKHGRIEVIISYGGKEAPYAVVQHERLDYKHTPPQQAKYLSQPAMEAVRTMGSRVARMVKAFGATGTRAVTSSRSGGTTFF